MFIKIGGVPASGKTTIASTLTNCLKERGINTVRIHGADLMARVLGVDIKDLRSMTEEQKLLARKEMYNLMYEEDRRSPTIMRIRDAHFCLFDGGNSYSISPIQEGDQTQMKAFVVLEALPPEILRRRIAEHKTRADRVLDLERVQLELRLEREVANAQAEVLGIPLIVVQNYGRAPKEICQEICQRLLPRINLEQEANQFPSRIARAF